MIIKKHTYRIIITNIWHVLKHQRIKKHTIALALDSRVSGVAIIYCTFDIDIIFIEI